MSTQDWAFSGGMPPELALEQQSLKRRQSLADALLERSMQPLPTNQMAGGYVVPLSPFQGLAQLAQGYSARSKQKQAEEGMRGLGKKYQDGLADAVASYTRAKTGTPGSSETIIDEEANGGEGAQAVITAPPVAADPRKAITEAMMSQYPQVQRLGQMDLTQLNRQEDRKLQQEQRAFELRQAFEQKKELLEMQVREGRITREEADRRAADLRREMQEAGFRHERNMKQMANSLKTPPQPPQPRIIQTEQGPMMVGQYNKATPILGPDNKPIKAPARGAAPLSATAQKELFEADDVSNSARNAIDILKSIVTPDPKTGKSQNDIAYGGGLGNLRTTAMGFVPGNYAGENASVDLKNKVTGQALENLKAIFGGMPTEGERKILLEIQGSLDQTPAQRKKIFDRAIELAERRQKIAQDKAQRLREGTYFGAGVATNQDGGSVLDQADAILRGMSGNR